MTTLRSLDHLVPPAATAAEGASASSAPRAAVQAVPHPAPQREAVQASIARANRALAELAPALEFQIDPELNRVVMRLVDRQDHRVLRQVPSEELLAIARALDRMRGMLVNQRA